MFKLLKTGILPDVSITCLNFFVVHTYTTASHSLMQARLFSHPKEEKKGCKNLNINQ